MIKRSSLFIFLALNLFISGLQAQNWSYVKTNSIHKVIIEPKAEFGDIFEAGDKIGFFYDSLGIWRCAGFGIWESKSLIINVYGATESSSGHPSGQPLRLRVLRKSNACIKTGLPVFSEGPEVFQSSAVSKIISIALIDNVLHYPKEICQSQKIYIPTANFRIESEDVHFSANSPFLKIDSRTGIIDLSRSLPGSYTITVKSGYLCLTAKEFSVSIRPAPASGLKNRYYICENEPLTVSASLGYDYYRWSDGSTDFYTNISLPGVYWLEIRDKFGCSYIDTFTVLTSYLPPTALSIKSLDCKTVELEAPAGWASYEWSGGERKRFATVSQPGTYFVKLTSSEGCVKAVEANVDASYFESKTFDFQVAPATCAKGGVVIVDLASVTSFHRPIIYTLTNSKTGERLIFDSDVLVDIPVGNYEMYLTDAQQCTSKSMPLTIAKDDGCAHTIITPNGDGIDDFYYIPFQGVSKIYDKNGTLRIQLETPAPWDARDSDNQPLPMGTYFIVCQNQDVRVTVLK